MTRSTQRRLGVAGLGVSLSLVLSGCAGFGNLGNEPGVTTLTLASVNNPQMQDMSRLLPEFNKLHPDIKVNIIFLEEATSGHAIPKEGRPAAASTTYDRRSGRGADGGENHWGRVTGWPVTPIV